MLSIEHLAGDDSFALSHTSLTNMVSSSPSTAPAVDVTGVVLRTWNADSNNAQLVSSNTTYVEIRTSKNSHLLARPDHNLFFLLVVDMSLQIQYRTLERNHHICIGDRIKLRAQAILPLFSIPAIPDEVTSESIARLGLIVYPERDAQAGLEIISRYNVAMPQWVIDKYHEMRQGVRPQMTWKLLTEQIKLWESDTHLMYLSGLLAELRLLELWRTERLFCTTCDCGNVVFGNKLLAACPYCPDQIALELRPNPQCIARISDETAGLMHNHNLLVAERVWGELFGGFPTDISEAWLKERESRLRYVRLTWVFMWLGGWSGGRLVLVDVLE